jgi:hypothetical protein
MVTEITSKTDKIFVCKICDFICSKKGDFNRHLLTAKHNLMFLVTENDEKNIKINKEHICRECMKSYSSRNGLWVHMKKCINNKEKVIIEINKPLEENSISDIKTLTSLVLDVFKQNQDLQKQMLDICKNNNSIINSNNTNCNNKQFNLQFFLNEECKGAMNISDFMNSFTLQIADLEKVGYLGYVDGISDIIISKLKTMDIYSRPMHCSDAKRETIYVKEEGVWEKEESSNVNIKKVVRNVEKKNMNVLNDWKDVHTDCLKSSSRQNEDYLKLIQQSMGGSEQNENKVIRKIMKEVIINKKD